ncbi:MAG: lamin tail domain-containing protein [Flavobacteriales bacterium]|nr:lamin tail domain-containing protein [Flavobacteriales bacterium]
MRKLLLALAIPAFCVNSQAQTQDCSELFISEYVVGSGNNRALELYNPTNAPIDMAGYNVGRFRDGAGTPMLLNEETGMLTGTIAPYGTYVIVVDKRDPNGTGFEAPVDDALLAVGDVFVNPVYVQSNSPFYFNGDDAVPLIKGTSDLIDVVGRIGEDPGTAWSDGNGTWWTVDKTLIRKSTVLKGDTDGLDAFLPEVEWDSLPEDSFTNLGWHDCACSALSVRNQEPAKMNVFPNPSADKVLMISANKDIAAIEVYDIIGRQAEEVKMAQGIRTNRLDLSTLQDGIYVVRLLMADGTVASRRVMIGKGN